MRPHKASALAQTAGLGFAFLIGFLIEVAFEVGDNQCARHVTHHIDGRTDHVENTVDAGNQCNRFERNADLRKDDRRHDQTRTWDTSRTDGRKHAHQNDGGLIGDRERDAEDFSRKDCADAHIYRSTVHVDGVAERDRERGDGLRRTELAGGL